MLMVLGGKIIHCLDSLLFFSLCVVSDASGTPPPPSKATVHYLALSMNISASNVSISTYTSVNPYWANWLQDLNASGATKIVPEVGELSV